MGFPEFAFLCFVTLLGAVLGGLLVGFMEGRKR
jgi:hypothetical protein